MTNSLVGDLQVAVVDVDEGVLEGSDMPGILISPPLWVGEQFLSKLKNREEFDGGLHEKRKGKGGKRRKKKRMIKHMLKYLYEAK